MTFHAVPQATAFSELPQIIFPPRQSLKPAKQTDDVTWEASLQMKRNRRGKTGTSFLWMRTAAAVKGSAVLQEGVWGPRRVPRTLERFVIGTVPLSEFPKHCHYVQVAKEDHGELAPDRGRQLWTKHSVFPRFRRWLHSSKTTGCEPRCSSEDSGFR